MQASPGCVNRSLVSLEIAGLTALVCMLVGVPASYALVRYRFVGRGLVEELLGLPVVFPAVVLGISLLVLVSAIGIDFGIFQIVIAHSIIGLPFLMRNCLAAMRGIDPMLEEAAKTLGASDLQRILRSRVAAGQRWHRVGRDPRFHSLLQRVHA